MLTLRPAGPLETRHAFDTLATALIRPWLQTVAATCKLCAKSQQFDARWLSYKRREVGPMLTSYAAVRLTMRDWSPTSLCKTFDLLGQKLARPLLP